MDIITCRNNKSFINKKIMDMKLALERANRNNLEVERLLNRKKELTELYSKYQEYRGTLQLLKNKVSQEDLNFRTNRVEYVNSLITERLSYFFPNEGLKAKIQFTDKYKKTKAILRLFDEEGFSYKPSISQGGLSKYLITYAAIDGVVRSLCAHNIYIDEAFGVSSVDNLEKVADMLNKSTKSGMQIILISQNPELYNNIPHREIEFHKDADSKAVVVDRIEDCD